MGLEPNVSGPAWSRPIPSVARFISDCFTLADGKSHVESSARPNVDHTNRRMTDRNAGHPTPVGHNGPGTHWPLRSLYVHCWSVYKTVTLAQSSPKQLTA